MKVVTGMVTFAFVNVFEMRAMSEQDKPKYSVCLIIPKSDTATLSKIKKAIDKVAEDGKAKLGGKVPKNLKTPLRDGDEEREDDPNFEGCMFMNCGTYHRPGVVDAERNEIIDKEEIYSGCKGRASINFYVFNTSGNKGVAAGLNGIQKLENGERMSGGFSADDFGDDDLAG